MPDKKYKVLIVDDMPENIRILMETLKSEYATIPAVNGKAALQKALSDNPPDLILLDIILPDMDGYEVCRQLKSNEKTKKIPVIFITALSETMDEVKGFDLGGVDYITKPFKPATVKARVKNHIDLKVKSDMLEQLISIDSLTGINNRRKFDELFLNEWNRSCREKTALSLVLIDIDHFKYYNDNYGHANGDECLKMVAKSLENGLQRTSDVICRYGGEEFIAILPNTDFNGAVNIAEKLRHEVSLLDVSHDYNNINEKVTISIGVASTFPAHHCSPKTLIESADTMMYQSKRNGRNRVSGTELPCG